MDKQAIEDKIKELDRQWHELQSQAEQGLSYLKGQIDAYKQMLAEMDGEAEIEPE